MQTYLNPEQVSPKQKVKQVVRQILGYLIAIACLVWVFHDIHAQRLFQQVASIKWGWVLLAVFFDTFSYFAQGWRWKLLLRPTGQISPLKSTQAIYIGLFTNEIVPLRVGELVRTYIVSRWIPTSFFSVIPSLVVERLFDAVWLGIGIGLTAMLVHLPGNLVRAAEILGIIVLGGISLFVYLVLRQEKAVAKNQQGKPSGWKPFRLLTSLIDRLARGIRDIGISRYLFWGFLVSSLVLIFQIFSFWLVMWAYGLRLSLWIGAAILLIEHLGTAIPNAPSNLGTYQFFVVVGLALFGVDKTTATGFSVVVFIVLTLPLWLIGLVAVSRSGMTLKEIRQEITGLIKH
jgi:uncharacterized protein (TIRG00374 family)